MDTGAKFTKKRYNIGLGEDHDVVDGSESGDKLGASLFLENRAGVALEGLHAGIGIHRDDENIALVPRGIEIADVAYVENIEAAVGEDDALAAAAMLIEQSISDLRERIILAEVSMRSFVCRRGGGGADGCVEFALVAVAVPRFMTTMPPAKLARCAASRNVAPAARASVKTAMTVSPAPVTSAASSEP